MIPRRPAARPRLSLLLMPVVLLWLAAGSAPAQEVISDIRRIQSLTDEERRGVPAVKVSGLVLSVLPDGEHFCLAEGTNLIVVARSGRLEPVAIGDRVRVSGKVTRQGPARVAAERIEHLGTEMNRPDPLPHGERLLGEGQPPFRWVRAEGYVHALRKSAIGWHFDLIEDGRFFTAVIPRRGRPVTPEFLHARVRLSGVTAPLAMLGDGPDGLGIWVDGWVRMERLAPPAPPAEPVPRSISEALDIPADGIPNELLRLRGQVRSLRPGGGFLLSDPGGQIEVRLKSPEALRIGDYAAAIGYLTRSGRGVVLTATEVRLFAVPQRHAGEPDWEHLVEMIQDVRSIRRLSQSALAVGPPVRVAGVVTLAEPDNGVLYLTNRTGSIRVESTKPIQPLQRGEYVRVTGHAAAGSFGPIIRAAAIERLEQMGLPRPRPVLGTSLLAGRHEAEFISFDGVVRRMEREGGYLWVTIARSDRRYRLRLPGGAKLPTPLVGARIEFNGVARARVNEEGQIVGCDLLLSGADDLKVTRPAPADPFTMRATDIGSFMRFSPDNRYTRMKHVTGTVLLAWPDRLFVEDATGAMEVRTVQSAGVGAGDVVSCVGFPLLLGLKPVMVDARVKKEGAASLPPARAMSAEDLLTARVNGRRVRVEAIVTTVAEGAIKHFLALQAGGVLFSAELPNALGGAGLKKIRPGSRVAIEGVCDFHPGEGPHPDSFTLLLASLKDLVVLRQPSWFTPERSILILICAALLIVIALGWAQLLRLRVAATESALARSLELSPVAVGVMSADGERLIEANPAFLRQFGFTRDEITGKTIAELGIWPSGSERARVLERCREKGAVAGMETQMRSGAGNTLRVLVTAEPIQWENSRAILLVAQDVTERLELVNQLRESQKMEAVGQLAAGVAHDFNNILTIIQGNSDMIAEEAGPGSAVCDFNRELNNAAQRAASLVRQLLSFSRKQLMRPRILDLNDVVEESLKMLKRLLGAPIEIVTRLSEQPPNVYADSGMLEQVLMNLAVNSRDAMPAGGRLTVSTRVVRFAPGSRIEGRIGRGEEQYVQLRVADTGEGMPPEILERIFEPFFTTKDVGKGTGLGLSTVYGIARQHGGWLEAESEAGRGTSVSLFLPLAETEADVLASEEPAAPDRTGTETVLVVEDEPPLRRMVERTLARHGYTVHAACDGPAAREKWAELNGRVDLLITDIVMPRGVSGWQLADEFRKQRPDLPVIYISGYSSEFKKQDRVLERGRNFLPKPFTQRDLTETVRRALDGELVEA